MNFFRAWSNFCKYCKNAGLTTEERGTIQQFAQVFNEGKQVNHEGYNYVD